jgi:GNAT superfamily N-acetyltransferase
MNIRAATKHDSAMLAAIHADAWFHGFRSDFGDDVTRQAVAIRCTAERWSGFLDATTTGSQHILLAEDAGLIQLGVDGDRGPEVLRMYAKHAYWGTGVAHALMDTAKDWFRSKGATKLAVWSANTPQANRFYEKCGFTPTGETRQLELLPGLWSMDAAFEMAL